MPGDREDCDYCSQNGCLPDLTELVPDGSPLTTNQVILEDNAVEYDLGQAETYIAVTEEAANGLDLSKLPIFEQAGFSGQVYLGVIANTPRPDQCGYYIVYLLSADR